MQMYYISKNENHLGPFSFDVIQAMLISGEISSADFWWTEGMEQWLSIQQWDAAHRVEAKIKAPTPHMQPLGQGPLQKQVAQVPQMKTADRPRKRKGMLIGVIVAAAIVLIVGAFVMHSHRTKNQQVVKNIDAATSSNPFVNSLGMKFVPVPIKGGDTDGQSVLFCVWETRHRDFKAFVDATDYDATKYRGKTMDVHWDRYDAKWGGVTTDHPVIYVSWEDAQAFCQWLTKKERDAGTLTANQKYRLPTDHEWSCAVGIGGDENASEIPGVKSRRVSTYPWGGSWPPPRGAGNYWGEDMITLYPDWGSIKGYHDGFSITAPVGSFRSNDFGIYDLSGNVWEWCEDAYSPSNSQRVTRGGSWYNANLSSLLSSNRANSAHFHRSKNIGFRCVVVSSP